MELQRHQKYFISELYSTEVTAFVNKRMLCATAIGENAKEKNFARSDFSAPIAEEIVKNNRGK